MSKSTSSDRGYPQRAPTVPSSGPGSGPGAPRGLAHPTIALSNSRRPAIPVLELRGMPTRALVLFFCIAPLLAAAAKIPPLPPTPKKPVTETILRRQGAGRLPLARELERPRGADVERGAERPRPRRPRRAAEPRTPSRSGLRSASPGSRPATRQLVRARRQRSSPSSSQPPKQQPFIVPPRLARRPGPASGCSSTRTPSIPPAATTIDFFVPSLDGKHLAVSLSKGGTESGDVHVYDVADRQALAGRGPAGEQRHRGRQPGVERGRERLLLHAPPGEGRAPAGGPALLPAGLLPRARHPRGEGHLLAGQGLPAHRRGPAHLRRGRGAGRRPGAEGRRRRVRALPARPPRRAPGPRSRATPISSRTRSSAPTARCGPAPGRDRPRGQLLRIPLARPDPGRGAAGGARERRARSTATA